MTREEWTAQLAARAADAEKLGALVPLSRVLKTVLEELDGVDGMPTTRPVPDQMLTMEETAQRMGVSKRWLIDNRRALPFLKTYTAGGMVRASENELRRWLKTR